MSFAPRPKGIPKPRSAAKRREGEPGKLEAARAFRLAVTGGHLFYEAHHALPASWLRDAAWREGLRGEELWAAVYDPQVGVPLLARVHERHTSRAAVIPLERLPSRLVAYVAERWGAAGEDALRREHPPADEPLRSRPTL